jgi:hypothetical protein
LRGYQEDSPAEQPPGPPGSAFDLTLPVWRVGEVLLHAAALASRLGVEDEVTFHFRWTGLAGRRLLAWASRRHLFDGRESHESEVEVWVAPKAADIQDRLPELVQQATRHLYEVFDFFAPSASMFHEELARMRSRTL